MKGIKKLSDTGNPSPSEKEARDKIDEIVEKCNKLEDALFVSSKGVNLLLKIVEANGLLPVQKEDKEFDFFK